MLLDIFVSRVAARPIIILRFVIGTVCVFRAVDEWRMVTRVFRPGVVRFPVFEWLPIVNRQQALALVAVWFISAVAFTVGWHVRVAGLVLAAVMGTTLLLDQQLYSSNLYLLSLDTLLIAIANPTSGSVTAPYWPILLLKIQLSLVYFFAALAKLNPLYLSGFMIERNLRQGLTFEPSALKLFAVSSVLAEIFLAAALWIPRVRKLAVVFGALFHVAMVAMLTPIVASQLALFAVECLAIYPLYFVAPTFSYAAHTTSTAHCVTSTETVLSVPATRSKPN